ncbi:MAG: protein-L-isoaspartate O-methyltransferase [Pseudomonadota bacterium]
MNLQEARDNMVEQQIRPWNVLDQRVLNVLSELPRDAFVPAEHASLAYSDTSISLGEGATMLRPNVEGRLLQALRLTGTESVLHVGTGSGYLTACLARLSGKVCSVDRVSAFTESAGERLEEQGIDNVELETGDACEGWRQEDQFDAIAISAAVPEVPECFEQQLAIGGRLFAIIGEASDPIMEAVLVTRLDEDRFERRSLFETHAECILQPPSGDKFVF